MAEAPESMTPPPPGAALLQAVGDMKPVRTRAPLRTLLVVLAAGLVLPIAAVVRRTRADLPFLPVLWVVAMAVAWTVGVIAPLVAAVLPRRGEVLPDGGRAGRVAAVCASLLVLLGLLATVDAPGRTTIPESFPRAWWHCVSFGLKIMVPVFILSAVVLRRLHPVGSWRVAAALGAAGGALGGLTLHFICSYGGGLHVGLAHAGGVVIGAVLGALVLAPFLKS
jgi:negative regulator of sigma F NrsF-like protein